MLGIKIRDQFLALFADTSLTFEENHPVGIIIDGISQLQGSYTIPIDIPIEGNASLLGRIDRLDMNAVLMQDEYCEVWVDGLPFRTGKATIKGATHQRAKMFIVFNEVKELSDLPLSSVDLGGDRIIGSNPEERTNHAYDTASDPLNHDYIFTPILNPRFSLDPLSVFSEKSNFQNFWNHDTDSFYEGASGNATPFIRIDYLLARIFRELGYTLDNQFQTTDELKLLLLYNNFSIYINGTTWSETINLTNHVPYAQALDFVKAMVATFALCLFPDQANKTMELIPFKMLIQAPVFGDWTSKAGEGYEYETDKDFISILRYDIDTNDELSVAYSGTEIQPSFLLTEGLTARIMYANGDAGYCYAIADNTYYSIVSNLLGPFETRHYRQEFKRISNGGDKEYISPLIPLWNSWQLQLDGNIDSDYDTIPFQEWQIPHIQHKGFIAGDDYANLPCTSFRTMFYRGFQFADVDIDEEYPFASVVPYNIRGELIGDYSLLWDREQGIYNRWWKLPYEMLANKKTVSRTLLLTIGDLLSFKFKHKYRIENQNYFMTRLRYTISSKGLSPVEAVMITSI